MSRPGILVGVDLGGSHVRVAVAEGAPAVGLVHTSADTTKAGSEALVDQIVGITRKLLAGRPASRCVLGVPGVVPGSDRRVNAAYVLNVPGLGGADIAGKLAERLACPVWPENDLNLAALGEWLVRPEPRPDPFAFVGLGTGLGAGIITGGRLLRGANGAAGEIAHLPVSTVARHGTAEPWLEKLTASPGVIQELRVEIAAGSPTVLTAGSTIADMHAAAGTDRLADRLVSDQAWWLAHGVAAVALVIDPELIVLGGGIGASSALRERLLPAVARLLPAPVNIVPAHPDGLAGIRGAIALAFHQHQEESR